LALVTADAADACIPGGPLCNPDGKTGRKLSKDKLENLRRKIKEAKEELDRANKVPNKDRAAKEAVKRAERLYKKLWNDLSKSEPHAKRAQGSN